MALASMEEEDIYFKKRRFIHIKSQDFAIASSEITTKNYYYVI